MSWPWPTFPIQGSRLVSAFRGDYNQITEAILSAFTGPDEPTQKFPGMFWVDTSVSPKILRQRDTTNTTWIIRARIDVDFGGALPLAGGTMEGGINMGGFPITNLPLGTGNAPARYSDLAAYSLIDGSRAFTGIPSLPAQDPSLPNQVARKAYVDTRAAAGGALSAQISLPVAATAATHAMRKQEYDSGIAAHTHTGAIGMGPQLQPSSISPSAVIGRVLRVGDTGQSEWLPPVLVTNGLGPLVFDVTGATGETEIDLSSYAPKYAAAAILLVSYKVSTKKGGRVYLSLSIGRYGGSYTPIIYSQIPSVIASDYSGDIGFSLESQVQVVALFNDATPNQKIIKLGATKTVSGIGWAADAARIQAWYIGYL
jgi:hypothetical protein